MKKDDVKFVEEFFKISSAKAIILIEKGLNIDYLKSSPMVAEFKNKLHDAIYTFEKNVKNEHVG